MVPICYALVGDSVYSALDEKPKSADDRDLRRIRNLLQNPRLALVVDVWDEDWTRLGFVLLRGLGELVQPGDAEHAQAIGALRARYPQYASMKLEERAVIALRVELVTTWGAV